MRGKLLSFVLHLVLIVTVILIPQTLPRSDAGTERPVILSRRVFSVPRIRGETGGGGQRSPLVQIAKGALPRMSPRPFVPPTTARPVVTPMLAIEPAILGETDIASSRNEPLGIPFGVLGGMGGRGKNGLGGGDAGGIGDEVGPRLGGVGTRGGVEGPVLTHRVEAEYSDEARKARYQGTVVLEVEVDATGAVSRVRVRQSLGLGLDEKAIAAVRQWRFRPATRNGKPVNVPALVEVNFRLL